MPFPLTLSIFSATKQSLSHNPNVKKSTGAPNSTYLELSIPKLHLPTSEIKAKKSKKPAEFASKFLKASTIFNGDQASQPLHFPSPSKNSERKNLLCFISQRKTIERGVMEEKNKREREGEEEEGRQGNGHVTEHVLYGGRS